MEGFAIGADFEGAAARRHERERRDPIAEVENFSRQTDGFRRVVSNAAILDPDFGFHRSLLSKSEINGEQSGVKRAKQRSAAPRPGERKLHVICRIERTDRFAALGCA
jgi:hypothetical protein